MKKVFRAAAAGDRRVFLQSGLAAAVSAALPRAAFGEPAHDTTYAQDFDELWETLRDHYCFFGEKRTDWNLVRQRYRPLALAAESHAAFEEQVGRVLCELYDAHTHLTQPPDGARRWPLYDLMAERAGQSVRIAAVQPGSAAADGGLRIGDVITAVGGESIRRWRGPSWAASSRSRNPMRACAVGRPRGRVRMH
jgi:carboxyl-terminal processing protease